MPEHDDPSDEESTWPAVASAYDFVMPSYRLLSDRFDAAEARLGSLFGVTSTLTLAVPVFARTVHPEISFTSPWFVAAVLLFLASAVVSIVGRMWWHLILPNPKLIYQRQLHESEWTFKKNAIHQSGEAFEHNKAAVYRKWQAASTVTGLLAVEIVTLIFWVSA